MQPDEIRDLSIPSTKLTEKADLLQKNSFSMGSDQTKPLSSYKGFELNLKSFARGSQNRFLSQFLSLQNKPNNDE